MLGSAQYKFNKQFLKVTEFVLIWFHRANVKVQWPHVPLERTVISPSLYGAARSSLPPASAPVYPLGHLVRFRDPLMKNDLN